MIIETGLLSEAPRRFQGEDDPSFLELEEDLFFRAREPVRYDLCVRMAGDELLVTGSVVVCLSCLCARCDEWVKNDIDVPGFCRTYKLTKKNETVDLTDDVREDILLALPTNFVCSSSCSGLCPRCGRNLNRSKCSCPAESAGGLGSLELT